MNLIDLERNLIDFVERSKQVALASKFMDESRRDYENKAAVLDKIRSDLKSVVGRNIPEKFFSVNGSIIHIKWNCETDTGKSDVVVRLVEVEKP